MRPHFRFEDLEIWQRARNLAVQFHRLAEQLEQRHMRRYAEQLRGAGLSLPNNIAEGSGSTHAKELNAALPPALFPGASPGDGRLSLSLGTTRGLHSPAGAELAGRRPNPIWVTPQQAAGNVLVFKRFLNIARNSAFEDASMLMVFESMGLVKTTEVDPLLAECDLLSRKITNFSRTLVE